MSALAGRRVAVLTLSTRVARGEQQDTSGQAIVDRVRALGGEVAARDVLPDDRTAIASRLLAYSDDLRVDLVLTTGGSGVASTDVTPEATLDVVERVVPGLPEAARQRTTAGTPLAMLSRSACGIRGRTMILNLPGSPKGVNEWLDVLLPALPHALDLLAGEPRPWGAPHTP